MEPAPASLGEFRISAVLGQGGSGIVYDASWGPRRVALKVLHPTLVGTGKERSQFLAEAQRLQQIAHPSVVKVFAVGELPDGRPYLAMERLAGETLAKVLERGPLALPRALALFTQLAEAVAALHAQGLVHRDLKPENVFVVGTAPPFGGAAGRAQVPTGVGDAGAEHAVLLDFGIAKELEAAPSTTTQEGRVRGTPAYMAPERFFGQPAGLATDVYELALCLYAMLAGRLPWDQLADPEARLSPRPLGELAAVPEALDVEIRRALSTRAQNRPASARALLDAVLAAAGGSAAAAGPMVTSPLRRPPGQARAAGDIAPTPEQPTPLAWAPTMPGPGTTAKRSQGRWRAPLAVAATLGIAVGGFAVWRRARTSATGTAGTVGTVGSGSGSGSGGAGALAVVAPGDARPATPDPWSTAAVPVQEAAPLPLVEPKLSAETYRAEVAAAVARLPADTRFVFTAELGELHAQPSLDEIMHKLPKDPRLQFLTSLVPPCVRALAADSEWVALGAPAMQDFVHGTFVFRGRWHRKDVDACFGPSADHHVATDHAVLYKVGDGGWLDFVDDHTAYITLKADLDPEAVHELVRHGAGPQQHARDLFAHLPADRSIAIVVDGKGGDDLSDAMSLPKGSDVFGWVRAEPAGVTLDVAADPHGTAAAREVVARVKPQLDQLFGSSNAQAVGRLDVVTHKTVVHVRGNLTALMLGIVSGAL